MYAKLSNAFSTKTGPNILYFGVCIRERERENLCKLRGWRTDQQRGDERKLHRTLFAYTYFNENVHFACVPNECILILYVLCCVPRIHDDE